MGGETTNVGNKKRMRISAVVSKVPASSGVADGKGSFGYVIYVRPEDFDAGAKALGI